MWACLQIMLCSLSSFEVIQNQGASTDAPDWKLCSHLQIDTISLYSHCIVHLLMLLFHMQSVFVVGFSRVF